MQEFRNRLCSTKDLALHCQGKINISLSGYDEDPRELFEIEEVRQYVGFLDEALPELFFFARTEEPGNTIGLFIFCLVGIRWEGERSTPGNPQKVIVEYGSLGPFLERHFMYLNYMAEWTGLPQEELARINDGVAKSMGMPEEERRRAYPKHDQI